MHRYGICVLYGREVSPSVMQREMNGLQSDIREYLESRLPLFSD